MAASVLKQDPNTSNVQNNAIIMSTFFQALHRKTTQLNQKQISDLAFHLIFLNCFSPLNCCLSDVLWLDKGDYPENLQIEFLA